MQGNGKMKKNILWGIVFLFACAKEEFLPPNLVPPQQENWVFYQIDSGQHFAQNNTFKLFQGDSLRFRFFLDSTAIYQTTDPANQLSWSKLYGFADCNSHHHTNSVRLVWRYNPAVGIELAGYYYAGTQRSWQILDTIQPLDTLQALIYTTDTTYGVQVGNRKVSSMRNCSGVAEGYYLYPYFGGTEPAPQLVRIGIQEQ